ncbi:MAG: phenylalanine--tRNA ligase subunit alpha [Bdellovibrionales bacterium]
MLPEKINQLVEESYTKALAQISQAANSSSLYEVKVEYLGKQGKFTSILKGLSELPKEERPEAGKIVNVKKQEIVKAYEAREVEIEKEELNALISKETFNFSVPRKGHELGSQHPITKITDEMVGILSKIGFSVRTGPHIESDENNFSKLNFPKDHPARDMQDTFYIDPEYVLRTHTSPIQVRTLENEALPLRILAPGAVFRCDSDISHSPNFNQVEGLYVDKNVSMSHLKGIIGYFVRELFGEETKTRFRPSFFPFTEPSAEVDCTCPLCSGKGCRVCSNSGWIEIGGCGLVHPNVLTSCGIDSEEWQGLAFGFGAERMAMIKYGIGDIRLFNENLINFVGQF